MIANEIIRGISSNGWAEVADIFSHRDLYKLAEEFGKIAPHANGDTIGKIVPKVKANAIKNTLSYQHGLNSFPFHTDTAFWVTPARYIFLYSDTESQTSTKVLHSRYIIRDLEKVIDSALLYEGIFLYRTPSNSFYSSILNRVNNFSFIRFDENIMKPVNETARIIFPLIIAALNNAKSERIIWDRPKLLIFDNWNVLHGREKIMNRTEQRILNRIYIKYELGKTTFV